MSEAKRILVLSHTAVDAERFKAVTDKLALELLLACSDESAPMRLDFDARDSALRVVEFAHEQPLAAVIPVQDAAAPVAARACNMLGLPFHTPRAADACKDKVLLKRRLVAQQLASETDALSPETSDMLHLTCIMSESRLRVLVVSDATGRRSPLSEIRADIRERVIGALRTIVGALGLKHGPVHVQLAAGSTPCVRDVSLGATTGDTAGMLFRIPLVEQDMSFEEVVVRNALGLDIGRIYLDLTNAPAR
jgi:hypothetical protein